MKGENLHQTRQGFNNVNWKGRINPMIHRELVEKKKKKKKNDQWKSNNDTILFKSKKKKKIKISQLYYNNC